MTDGRGGAMPPAGWHDDPSDPTQVRYWDGQRWTEHLAPKPGVVPAGAPPLRSSERSDGAAPAFGASPIVGSGSTTPWWRRWYVLAGALIVALTVVGVALGGSDDDSDAGADDTDEETRPESTEPAGAESEEADPPETSESPTTEAPTPSDVVAGAPDGVRGTITDPVPAGEIADIGDGWRLQVLEVVEDATDLVLAENQFNDPPPDGARFSFVRVAIGYFGFDDPAIPLITSIGAVGSERRELDSDCGVIPDELNPYADVFAGGVRTGNLCFVTTPADGGALALYASPGFAGPEVFFRATGPAADSTMASLDGPQEGAHATPLRLDPLPVGETAELGDGWSFTVTSGARDITDAVLAENQFNDPPPDGYRFVGVEVAFAYDGDESGSAFLNAVKAVATTNVELDTSCGVVPDEVDVFADVFAGGVVDGTLCFVVPETDEDPMVLYTASLFGGDPVYLSTEDPAATDASAPASDDV